MKLLVIKPNLGEYIVNHLGEGNVNKLLREFSNLGFQSNKTHLSWDWLQDWSEDCYKAWAKHSNVK